MAKLPRVARIGLVFLASNVLGYILAVAYNLPSCANGCNPGSTSWPGILTSGNGLEAPWYLVAVFVLALWLNARRDRWGMIGTVLAALYGIAYIGGESSEPFNLWANQNNNGLEVFLWASFALAGGTVIDAVWEIVIRARNGWRLPVEKPA